MGKTRSKIIEIKKFTDMTSEKKPNPEQELRDKIRQALLKNSRYMDKEKLEFLLKRL